MKLRTMIIAGIARGRCVRIDHCFRGRSRRRQGFDAENMRYAQGLLEEGRKIFRYDTFGSEAFWGDALQLHKAIAGEKNGGVGPGVSPKTALSVGLKVDADALPDALKKQLKAGKVNLDDPATTIALLKLNAVVGRHGLRQSRRQRQVDGHPVRVLSLDRRQLVRARHRQAAGRLGQPRSQRRRDRVACAEPQAVHRSPRRRCRDGEESSRQLGPGPLRRGAGQGRQGPSPRRASRRERSSRPRSAWPA